MSLGIDSSDATAIRELSEVHARGLSEGAVDLYLTACTEDITFIPPDRPPISGRDAAREYLKGFPEIDDIAVNVEEVEGSGGLAYSRGVTQATMSGGSKVRFKWIAVHRREADGHWRMARDLWSVET